MDFRIVRSSLVFSPAYAKNYFWLGAWSLNGSTLDWRKASKIEGIGK
jgi:hypothetical protein